MAVVARRSSLTSKGSTRAWRRRRAAVLARDGGLCRLQLPGCTTIATTVDHLVPRALGGGDEGSNLAAACSSCNGLKGMGGVSGPTRSGGHPALSAFLPPRSENENAAAPERTSRSW